MSELIQSEGNTVAIIAPEDLEQRAMRAAAEMFNKELDRLVARRLRCAWNCRASDCGNWRERMIVNPGTKLFFVNIGEDGGVCIGEIGAPERWVEIPRFDAPKLIKRVREVAREIDDVGHGPMPPWLEGQLIAGEAEDVPTLRRHTVGAAAIDGPDPEA